MDPAIVELWADIGSEEYWDELIGRGRNVFVPFQERWPQPGFIGEGFFDSPTRILVMGQNPNAPKNKGFLDDDEVLFDMIRKHSQEASSESLESLFALMPEFMLGGRYVGDKRRRGWKSIATVEKHLGLRLNNIAYLNLNPLTLIRTEILTEYYKEAFELSTKKQLKVLNPDKIVIYGKGAYDNFVKWEGNRWRKRVRYLFQERYANSLSRDKKRKYEKKIGKMRIWLKS